MKTDTFLTIGDAAALIIATRENSHFNPTETQKRSAGRVIWELGRRCDSQAKAWLRQEFPGKSWKLEELRSFGGILGYGFGTGPQYES